MEEVIQISKFLTSSSYEINTVECNDATIRNPNTIRSLVLYVTEGADNITGYSSNDALRGDDGNDSVLGQVVNDNVFSDSGGDFLYGDVGSDTCLFHVGFGEDRVSNFDV